MLATTVVTTAVAAGVIAAPVIAGLGYRAVRRWRTARATAIRTRDGIAEERFVRVGGIDQWIGIRGEDRTNPVLLVLHGGPGSPYSVFTPLLRSWEKHFTVVQWDRRGAGKTLGRNGKAGCGELTLDRMVDDAAEVVEHLREHLRQDKVVLLAGSMGTLVGAQLALRRPGLFHAYVATDCYVDMLRNEAAGYRMTLDRVRAAGNGRGVSRAVAALERIGPDPSRWDVRAWGVKMQWAMRTDPVTPNGAMKLMLSRVLTSPAHTLRDVAHWFSGFAYSRDRLFDEFMAFDARRLGSRFEVPYFLFQGDTDVVTLTGLAEEYFAELQAPTKALVRIRDAGHFCAFTRPEEFLRGLLSHVRPLTAPQTTP
ncbi:alpha/beta fold hydrolase [Rugosimonospora africana]|uniref:Proline iminopeptidase n=1 Tax=Rugosimonospora africana TaxID=556532 RepID=A0A8J3QYZ0_9ACTN|nr:alpha/beta hydrolase [Rugosimonospora africana]GIH18647.1 proline iminopeptidase [Rugosimonospora africana]